MKAEHKYLLYHLSQFTNYYRIIISFYPSNNPIRRKIIVSSQIRIKNSTSSVTCAKPISQERQRQELSLLVNTRDKSDT